VAGTLLPVALEAAARLESEGIGCAVCSCPVVKPTPVALLETVFERFAVVGTVEEHGLIGGFGSIVAEWLVDCGRDSRALLRFGVGDEYAHHATTQRAERERAGLTAQAIATRVSSRVAALAG
jgi:transketolase